MVNHVHLVFLAAVILAVSLGGWQANELPSFGLVKDVISPELGEVTHLLFFGKEGCGNCQRMMAALDAIRDEHPHIEASYLDIDDASNEATLQALLENAGIDEVPKTYPVIFVGDTVVVGEGRIQELQLRAAIESCTSSVCSSPMSALPHS